MAKLPMPVVCECGFATMDAGEAIKHIREKHPELLEEGGENHDQNKRKGV